MSDKLHPLAFRARARASAGAGAGASVPARSGSSTPLANYFNSVAADPAIRRFNDLDMQLVATAFAMEKLFGSIAAGDPESVLHGPFQR